MAFFKGYGWLLTGLFAIGTTACFESEKDDEEEEEEETTGFTGSDGADGNDGNDGNDGTDANDGTNDGADGGDGDYSGNKEFAVSDLSGSWLCSAYWTQAGSTSSELCSDCTVAFDVSNTDDGDDCGFGIGDFTSTLGFGGTYYFDGYGDYAIVQALYNGEWGFYGINYDGWNGDGNVSYQWGQYINDGDYFLMNYGEGSY